MSKQLTTYEIEDQIDFQFIQRVQSEVTQSCALPFAIPAERIPEFVLQAAQFWWQNDDHSAEERYYMIPNSEICKGNKLNKIAQLPPQILGVHGVYKLQQNLRYGAMGDFSLERMMMSSYSMFGGAGTIGGGRIGDGLLAHAGIVGGVTMIGGIRKAKLWAAEAKPVSPKGKLDLTAFKAVAAKRKMLANAGKGLA